MTDKENSETLTNRPKDKNRQTHTHTLIQQTHPHNLHLHNENTHTTKTHRRYTHRTNTHRTNTHRANTHRKNKHTNTQTNKHTHTHRCCSCFVVIFPPPGDACFNSFAAKK